LWIYDTDPIDTNRRVNEDVKNLPDIYVNSTSRIRMLTVLNALLDAFMSGRSILDTWLQAAIAADIENDIVGAKESSISFECRIENHVALHVCCGCWSSVLCKFLEYNDALNQHLCPNCRTRLEKTLNESP
jgi:hypothetical protein